MKKNIRARTIIIFTQIVKKTNKIPIINVICKTICFIMLTILLAIYYTGIELSRKVNFPTLFIISTVLLSLSTTSFIQISGSNLNEEIDISTRLELKTESPSQDAIEFENKEPEIDNRTTYDQNLEAEIKLDESIELSETEINILRSMISQEL